MGKQSDITINFKHLDVENCLKNFYVVPDYQREYVWEDKQVNQLLEDVYNEYSDNSKKEYFIGSIVVFRNDDGIYEVIDGQQRLTTLFLVINAFSEILENLHQKTSDIKKMIKDETRDKSGNPVDLFRLILQYEDSSDILVKISNYGLIKDKLIGSAQKINNAYENILTFINSNFKNNGIDLDLDQLKLFLVYILRKVKFIQVETPDISDALKIFETINERGVGLNPMDLLKNLIFRQIERSQFERLKIEWEKIIRILEQGYEKPLRFLRYFIMANYNVKNDRGEEIIREDEIYNWITRNNTQCNFVNEPFSFVKLLIENADCYVKFFNCSDKDGYNIYLDNIRKLGGGSFRQHLILLLAARKLDKPLFNHLAKQIEILIFFYIVTRESTKVFERNFSKWAKELLQLRTAQELNHFISKYFEPEINKMKHNFEIMFLEFNYYSLQQYRIKYVLSKIAQYLDQSILGSFEDKDLSNYITKGVEIEHILPDNPEEELRISFGEDYDNYKVKLGNLTLLEKSYNGSLGRNFYNEKIKVYKESRFYLTKAIAELTQIGINTAQNRVNQKLKSFSIWNQTSINERQEMLLNLAKDIWYLEYLV